MLRTLYEKLTLKFFCRRTAPEELSDGEFSRSRIKTKEPEYLDADEDGVKFAGDRAEECDSEGGGRTRMNSGESLTTSPSVWGRRGGS